MINPDSQTPPLPLLIVVTGRPGAGKTTLAHSSAQAIRCPAICRDEIKQGYVLTTGNTGKPNEQPPEVFAAFFEAVNLLLSYRITLIAEAAFQHKVWAPKLAAFKPIANLRLVICTVDNDIALSRRNARLAADPARQHFHHETPIRSVGDYDPPRIEVPTMTVDTSDGYQPNFEEIVSFASADRSPA